MERLIKDIELANPIVVNGNPKLTHIRLEVDHDKGGVSWGTGEMHKTGIKVNVTPIEVSYTEYNGVQYKLIGQTFDGKTEHQGFFVFCVPCGRKSPKKMEKVAEAVFPIADKIVENFLSGEYSTCADLIVSVTKNIK